MYGVASACISREYILSDATSGQGEQGESDAFHDSDKQFAVHRPDFFRGV
jgi:hypothetical protein